MKKTPPSMDLWLKEAKEHYSAPMVGMYLTHNGVVRESTKAKVRLGVEDERRVKAMLFSYDEAKLNEVLDEARTMQGIYYIQQPKNLANMKKYLPVFFIAGGDDPVGPYGKGVRQAAAAFEKSGMINVSTKIYPLCRHEILNETNRQEVYEDVAQWLEKNIDKLN